MTTSTGWFDVDQKGMRRVMVRDGVERHILEIISNAFDADGVKTVKVCVNDNPLGFMVQDDGVGVKDLRDLYTIFGKSNRAHDSEKRGRFCFGEKRAICAAAGATVTSVGGAIIFGTDGSRRRSPKGTTVGTRVTLAYDRGEFDPAEASRWARLVIPPENVEYSVTLYERNTDTKIAITRPRVIATTKVELPTEILNGITEKICRTRRITNVTVFARREGEDTSYIYELGIPVMPIDMPFHVDISQKVPLTIERDNVSPAFYRDLCGTVLSHTYSDLTEEQTSEAWVSLAMEAKTTSSEAVKRVVEHRYGEHAVVYDPSDLEANKQAVSKGAGVIPSRAFSKEAWENVRSIGLFKPAGQVYPTPKPFHPNGRPLKMMEDISCIHREFREAVVFLAEQCGIKNVTVRLANDHGWDFLGSYGRDMRTMTINCAKVDFRNLPDMLDLVIHELAHQYASNHLDEEYHQACTRLGGRMGVVLATMNNDPRLRYFQNQFDND